MMNAPITIQARHLELTAALKTAIEQKLSRACGHFDFLRRVEVTVDVDKNPRIQEKHHALVVLHVNGGLLKVEACSENLYATMDVLAEKAVAALKKYKDKHLKRSKASRSANGISMKIVGVEAPPQGARLADDSQDLDTEADAVLLFEDADMEEEDRKVRYPEAYVDSRKRA